MSLTCDRLLRSRHGGSWFYDVRFAYAFAHFTNTPESWGDVLGLRLLRRLP